MNGWAWLSGLWQDVRHGARVFAKHPGFTAIAIVSIAFGTGANVAIFSLADALLLRPLPVPRPSELVTVGTRVKRGIVTLNVASYPDYLDIRERSTSFTGLIALTSGTVGFSTDAEASPHVKLLTMVNHDFFQLLGVTPAIGRGFLPEEDRVTGRDAVAVLSHATWQQEFAADPSVIGRAVYIAGIEFRVVGVAPEGFTGLHPIVQEVAFVPLAMWPRVISLPHVDPLTARDFRNLTLKGRLRPGVTLSSAQAELAAIGKALEQAYPDTNDRQAVVAQTELEVRFERRPLDSWLMVVLTTLSCAVLCVACANVAGLLASRAPVRAREIALRMAVGAGRARLVRQLITESFGIAIAGGICGLAVGQVGVVLLRQIQFPTEVASLPLLQLNRRALVFSMSVAVASAFLFGLGPALQTTRLNLVSALKTTDADTTRRLRLTGRNLLVALQVALSLVLVAVSVWAFQVFGKAFDEGPGFRTSRMAKVTIDPSQARYGEMDSMRFFERTAEHARRLPGVTAATVTSAMPLFSFESTLIVPEGWQLPEGQTSVRTYSNSVDEGYFETMEIPILSGRGLLPSDTSRSARVAVVNETLARRYWPGGDAIGRRFQVDGGPAGEAGPSWVEIVGIARASAYGYFAEPPQDMVYFPFRQVPRSNMALLAQSTADSLSLVAPLRDMVRSLDAGVPVYDAQTIEMFYAARVTTIGTVTTRLVGGMGIMGVTLTMVGLYGLVSYSVSRRTREIGIRVAIGATSGRVLRMILGQGLMPAGAGLVAGLALSGVATRALSTLIPINQEYNPRSLFIVVPLLVLIAVLASYLPARRAANVDPKVALRDE
jgi:putative ABC transport system permease protein